MKQTSYKSIATKIITEAEKPLHYREITRIATEQGQLKTNGKTPWATMNAQLSMDIVLNLVISDLKVWELPNKPQ